jgi:hypothetical protein
MRTFLASGLLVTLFAVPLACGGGQAAGVNPAAKSPDTAATGAPSPASTESSGGSAGGAALDAGSATTTTTTLGNGGDLQGAKLSETHTVASTTGSAAPTPPPKGPHGHDPGRGPADIRAIVIAHRDEARACYDKSLAAHPGIEGDLVIQWTIDPKGVVTQISEDTARSQITEASVVACVGDVIKKIQFAPSPGGFETKAFYPFNFHPRHGTAAAGGQ